MLALWLSDFDGTEPVVKRLDALFSFCDKLGGASDSSKASLATCRLMQHQPWEEWLKKEHSRLVRAAVAQGTSRSKALSQKLKEIMGGLSILPDSSKEGAFRAAIAEQMNTLSSSSTLLKKRSEELTYFLEVLRQDEGEDLVETVQNLESRIAEAKALAQSIVTTLCFYAAFTLFRSSSIGGKSEQSKKGAIDLNSLLSTLFAELERTNPCKWLDEISMETILLQMGELAPYQQPLFLIFWEPNKIPFFLGTKQDSV